MKKSFLLLLIASISHAYIDCFNLDQLDEAMFNQGIESILKTIETEDYHHYNNECQNEGEGADFHFSVEWVSSCGGESSSKRGFIKESFTCNICTSDWVNLELENIENSCREDCLTSNYVCNPPAYPNLWGGELKKKNPHGEVCGNPLPNCTVSSSSISVESSSSEAQSSSSVAESSSSENVDSESSSSEYIDSSSSEEYIDSSESNDCGEGGDHCGGPINPGEKPFGYCEIGGDYRDAISNLKNVHVNVYNRLPYMLNPENINLVNCSCKSSRYVACDLQNVELVQGYIPYDMPICGYSEGYWCDGIENGACDAQGKILRIYYKDDSGQDGSWWAESFWDSSQLLAIEDGYMIVILTLTENDIVYRSNYFAMHHLFPANITRQDLENAILKSLPAFPDMNKLVAYCNNEWIPHDEDCFGTELEAKEVLKDLANSCAITYGISHYETNLSNRGWCVVGECEAANPYSSSTESSSSSVESSSSIDFFSASSSSEQKTEPFITGPDQEYTPTQIFSEGLQNMEEGKCYSLNPERERVYGWAIGTNAQDSWWWRTVDCQTGEEIINKIGKCYEYPMNSIPNNPYSECIAVNGSCYKCNSANVDCNQNWIWINGFNNDSWTYIEVDCKTGLPQNGDNCTDQPYALLKQTKETTYYKWSNSTNESYSIDFIKPSQFFDAKGRNIRKNVKWRRVYEKNVNHKPYLEKTTDNITSMGFMLKLQTNSGYVSAKHDIILNMSLTERENCSTKAEVTATFTTSIDKKPNYSNEDLQKHEMKHYNTYMKYNEKVFEEWYNLDAGISYMEACNEVKLYIWPSIRNLLTALINEQNKIDDNDDKNECRDRIPLQETIAEMKSAFDSKNCQTE